MSSIAVVPAAGQAERFGSQKLLAEIRGEALIDHTIASLLDGGVDEVIVVLAPDSVVAAQAKRFLDPRVRVVTNSDPSHGMFSSIQAGVAAAGAGEPLLVLPGDMPYVRAATVAKVREAAMHSGWVVSPRFNGRSGHPVAIPVAARAAILAAVPTDNLSAILKAYEGERLDLDVGDPGILRDVDIPGDLSGPA